MGLFKKIKKRVKKSLKSPKAFITEAIRAPITATIEGTKDTINLLQTPEGQAVATGVGLAFGPAGLAVSSVAIQAAII